MPYLCKYCVIRFLGLPLRRFVPRLSFDGTSRSVKPNAIAPCLQALWDHKVVPYAADLLQDASKAMNEYSFSILTGISSDQATVAVAGVLLQEYGFVEKEDVKGWRWLLETTKQVVVAGRPSTGKKYLAERLAEDLTRGQEDQECVSFVRLHPNLCYEDFVQGFRPDGGKFKLQVTSPSCSPCQGAPAPTGGGQSRVRGSHPTSITEGSGFPSIPEGCEEAGRGVWSLYGRPDGITSRCLGSQDRFPSTRV